eukprot:EG_transcript_12341
MSEALSNVQREFILSALRGGLRVDGRVLQAMRQPVAHFGAQTGQCEVSLGHTRALAVASCDVVEPMPQRANDGFLTFHTTLSPLADFAYSQLNRNSEEAAAISRVIERTIKGSRALDTEALCILAGKSVWSIRVEVTVLDNDGNVTDCCVLACLLALLHLRRPAITIEGDKVVVHAQEAREPVPLSIHHVPVCVSYALFDGGKLLVADPTLEEERCSSGRVLIGMNVHQEICLLDYPGGMPISSKVFRQLPRASVEKVKAIAEFIDRVLEEDKQRRRTEAMPVYARKFYEARKQQQQQQQQPTEGTGGTQPAADGAAVGTVLAGEDPFVGFLARVVRRAVDHSANGDAAGAAEETAAAAMEEDVEEAHAHDANAELGAEEEDGLAEDGEEEGAEEGLTLPYQQQVQDTAEAVSPQAPQRKLKKKKRKVATTDPL